MTKKQLEKYRIRIAILLMLNLIATLLGCIFSIFYIIQGQTIFILYSILFLISYFFTTAVLESLHFLLKERIYGEKNLEEDNSNQDKEPETKENHNIEK